MTTKKSKVKTPAYHRKGQAKQAKHGKALNPTFLQNCLQCFNFYNCRDPDKGRTHLCSKFSDIEDHADELSGPIEDEKALSKIGRSKKHAKQDSLQWNPPDDNSEESLEQFFTDMLKNPAGVGEEDFIFDDRDLPQANNFLQFAASKRFLGEKPYAKQVEIGINLHQEFCPRCSDIEWITNIPKKTNLNSIKEHAVLLKKGKCPKCKARKSELTATGELCDYYELAGMAGQRGGKTAVVGMLAGYTTHLFIKSPNPPKLFNLTKNMVLTGTFAAVTFDQALRNVWNPYVRPNITQSPWFSEYLKMLDYYEEKNGRPLYKALDTYVYFYHKNLFLSPYTPDRRTLRGATRFIASIDELGHFDSTTDLSKSKNSVRANSDETLAALGNSLMTLKNEHRRQREKGNDIIPNPMMLNVSSPLSKLDGIVRRVEAAKVDPQIYSFMYATWEMSPHYERNDPEITAAFAINKVNAARDWGAEPPMSRNAFVTNHKLFKHMVNPSKIGRTNAFSVERDKMTTSTGKKMTSAILHMNKRKRTNRILALDAGSSNNSFSFAMGRIDPESEYPMLEGLGEVIPYEGRDINFNAMYEEVIAPLIRAYGITTVAADRWQSKKILHDIEAEFEITADEFSLKLPEFLAYRESLFNGGFIMPAPEMPMSEILDSKDAYPDRFMGMPIAHFVFQNLTVVETLKTIEKGDRLTDDVFRAVVLMHSYLSDPEIKDEFMRDSDDAPERKRGGLGLVINQGGANAVSSASGIGSTSGKGGAAAGGGSRTFSSARH